MTTALSGISHYWGSSPTLLEFLSREKQSTDQRPKIMYGANISHPQIQKSYITANYRSIYLINVEAKILSPAQSAQLSTCLPFFLHPPAQVEFEHENRGGERNPSQNSTQHTGQGELKVFLSYWFSHWTEKKALKELSSFLLLSESELSSTRQPLAEISL